VMQFNRSNYGRLPELIVLINSDRRNHSKSLPSV
jgi:hypothetical protein